MGDKLKKLREEFGYSQEHVAEILDISIQSYSRYERGVREIPPKTLKKIKILFKIDDESMYFTYEEISIVKCFAN